MCSLKCPSGNLFKRAIVQRRVVAEFLSRRHLACIEECVWLRQRYSIGTGPRLLAIQKSHSDIACVSEAYFRGVS